MAVWLKSLAGIYGVVTLTAIILGVLRVIEIPATGTGEVSKLIFIHLPAAVIALGGALVVFVASVGYLGWRTSDWDRLANAAAEVTVVNATVLLLTGIFWAKSVWGQWWIVSPRLTFSFILWLLFVVYLILRSRIPQADRRATLSAVYGVISFLDVPLLYLSVKLLPDKHPMSSGLSHETAGTLAIWFVGMGLLAVGTMVLAVIGSRVVSGGSAGGSARGYGAIAPRRPTTATS
jgi:heme exporter protein C